MEHTTAGLRILTPDDIPAIMALIRSAFAAPPWNDAWGRNDALLRTYVTELTGNANSLALGWMEDGALAGAALGRLKHWFNGTEYCIDDFCVAPACQGRGVGTALLQSIRSYGRRQGFRQISLRTRRNAAAYGFYLKNGFQPLEESVCLTCGCETP